MCSVRAAAVEFVAAAASVLSSAEAYAQLLPLLQPALLEEPSSLTSQKACFSDFYCWQCCSTRLEHVHPELVSIPGTGSPLLLVTSNRVWASETH